MTKLSRSRGGGAVINVNKLRRSYRGDLNQFKADPLKQHWGLTGEEQTSVLIWSSCSSTRAFLYVLRLTFQAKPDCSTLVKRHLFCQLKEPEEAWKSHFSVLKRYFLRMHWRTSWMCSSWFLQTGRMSSRYSRMDRLACSELIVSQSLKDGG